MGICHMANSLYSAKRSYYQKAQLTRTTERVVTEMNRFAPTNNTLRHMSHTLYQRHERSSFKPCVRAFENWIIFCRKEKHWNSSLIDKKQHTHTYTHTHTHTLTHTHTHTYTHTHTHTAVPQVCIWRREHRVAELSPRQRSVHFPRPTLSQTGKCSNWECLDRERPENVWTAHLIKQQWKDELGTYSVPVNIGATNERETSVNKILVHKQKEKVESMKAVFFTVA